MNPERFERVKEILLRVLSLSAEERRAALDAACAGDPELRAEIEGLLAHDPSGGGGGEAHEAKDFLLHRLVALQSPTAPSAPSSPPPASASLRPGSSSDETTVAANAPPARFAPGQILGTRYRIVNLLGRGGMGEVWQAYDLKLQVDVALKAIRPERFLGEEGLDFLRREVRAAREVMSPNVCRIFDLVEEEGQEFVSMEYIDGETLLDLLRARGPLELQEATRIASQFLAGLEAIHQAGLVHRDVKPENIMITRTGRVVLMDFGVAKGIADDHKGTIAGTPAYMAPEQMRGETLDARADIFAAGVVLAEMSAPGGVRDHKSRESIWKSVRQTPVRLFESPWRAVLEQATAGERSQRHESARALARALEAVTLRVEGAEDKHPYPGLESFTAADAEFFFGREVEVETVWKKLQRANLLAIIGPSGAGKTSFLQAGLLPAKPADWRHVLFRPGSSPFVALTRALAPELVADRQALDQLLQIEDPAQILAAAGHWRGKHPQTLLVVDQFEELFTLGRPEVQSAFAELLGRLASEADVHVLLVMRDDFLFHCHKHPQLAPIASDLTMLGPPVGSALRRALVQPALLNGYRFEDESLADEMQHAIEGERGALPMLAFTAARLWEQRDRDRGLLTREAYERIGGVSGALAQHAEATLERIGAERQPIVREILRNLVTAQGTRAAAEVEELLSVFEDRKTAAGALRELVNARLLTSFKSSNAREAGEERRRVEIVHESLLTHWPRLVHWQTQDTEGAQLRDQLRQAAQLWKERHESQDLLWTGTAFREFELWRERYAGGLTAAEEAFARAMTNRAQRARRRRRRIVAGTITGLLLVAAAMTAFGIRAQIAQRRSEASNLAAQGRNVILTDPSYALAYAVASVEKADSPAGRRLVLEALSENPPAITLFCKYPYWPEFSPDGKRLAVRASDGLRILSRDGSPPIDLGNDWYGPVFAPDGDRVVMRRGGDMDLVRVWSLSEKREVRTFRVPGLRWARVRGGRLWLIGQAAEPGKPEIAEVRTWGFDDREPELVSRRGWSNVFEIDPTGRWLAHAEGRGIFVRPAAATESDRDRLVGELATAAQSVDFDPAGERIAAADTSGEIRLWPLTGGTSTPLRVITGMGAVTNFCIDPTGATLAVRYNKAKGMHLWDLKAPVGADPAVLRRVLSFTGAVTFDPGRPWLVAGFFTDLSFWPLTHPRPLVLNGPGTSGCIYVAFTPDGESLVCGFDRGIVRIYSMNGGPTRDLPVRLRRRDAVVRHNTVLDPRGRFLLLGDGGDSPLMVSLTDGTTRPLPVDLRGRSFAQMAISPDGQLAAGCNNEPMESGIPIWDLESGTVRFLEGSKDTNIKTVSFAPNGDLLSGDDKGYVRRWNLRDGSNEVLAKLAGLAVLVQETRDARYLFTVGLPAAWLSVDVTTTEFLVHDLRNHTSREITTHGNRISDVVFDPTETLLLTISGDVTRVGPITGEEPHILFGRAGEFACDIAVSPDGNWVATGDAWTPTVRLQRIPQGRPLQTLPHDEFLDRVRSLACFRVVPDPKAATGYRLDRAPFTGWEKVPTW